MFLCQCETNLTTYAALGKGENPFKFKHLRYLSERRKKPAMKNCNPRDASSKHANALLMQQGYTNQGRNHLLQRNMGPHRAKLSCGLRQVVAR